MPDNGRTQVRRTLTAAGVVGFVASAALLGASGTAAATTTATSCESSVSAPMGDALRLDPKAVKPYVVNEVHDGLLLKRHKDQVEKAYADDAIPDIELPDAPDSKSGTVSGRTIAAATVATLDEVDELDRVMADGNNRNNIRERITAECDLPVRASDYTEPWSSSPDRSSGAPAQQPPTSGTAGSGGSGGTSSTGDAGARSSGTGSDDDSATLSVSPRSLEYGSGSARAPRRDYGDLPFALPGTSGSAERSAEQFSHPGLSGEIGDLGQQTRDGADVDNAGNAEAIAEEPGTSPQQVQLPVLVAVVALAGVAAALVRTWVLRRV